MKWCVGFGSRPLRNEVLTSLARLYQIRLPADCAQTPSQFGAVERILANCHRNSDAPWSVRPARACSTPGPYCFISSVRWTHCCFCLFYTAIEFTRNKFRTVVRFFTQIIYHQSMDCIEHIDGYFRFSFALSHPDKILIAFSQQFICFALIFMLVSRVEWRVSIWLDIIRVKQDPLTPEIYDIKVYGARKVLRNFTIFQATSSSLYS